MLRKIHPVGRNDISTSRMDFTYHCQFSCFLPLDKGHVPENLWKLSVTYLFEDTDFPNGGLQPRFCNFATLLTRMEKEIVLRRIKEKRARYMYVSHEEFLSHCISNSFVPPGFALHWTSDVNSL